MRDEHPAGWRVLVGGELSQRTRQQTRSWRDRSSWPGAASHVNCSELPSGEQATATVPSIDISACSLPSRACSLLSPSCFDEVLHPIPHVHDGPDTALGDELERNADIPRQPVVATTDDDGMHDRVDLVDKMC